MSRPRKASALLMWDKNLPDGSYRAICIAAHGEPPGTALRSSSPGRRCLNEVRKKDLDLAPDPELVLGVPCAPPGPPYRPGRWQAGDGAPPAPGDGEPPPLMAGRGWRAADGGRARRRG